MFAPCLPEYDYGYENGAPCIFLSLSKINNWRPVSYNSSNMPIEMPKFLQKRIMDEEQRGTVTLKSKKIFKFTILILAPKNLGKL